LSCHANRLTGLGQQNRMIFRKCHAFHSVAVTERVENSTLMTEWPAF
jgi:hypothetical protein